VLCLVSETESHQSGDGITIRLVPEAATPPIVWIAGSSQPERELTVAGTNRWGEELIDRHLGPATQITPS